jgi:hypothetical protein
MKQGLPRRSLLAAMAMTICLILTGIGYAQQTVPIWNGSFVDKKNGNQNYPFTMVGADPTQGTGTTIVPVYVVPVKVVFSNATCQSGQNTFDPETVINANGTVVDNVLQSPIFTPIAGFPEEGSGTGQYIDAFQRGTLWYDVQQYSSNYHLNLPLPQNVTIVPEQTISATTVSVGAAVDDPTGQYGGCVGLGTVEWLTSQFPTMVDSLYASNLISPTGLVMFVLYDVFYGYNFGQAPQWQPGGAGAHSSTLLSNGGGIQTWLWSTYNGYDASSCGGQVCAFQDVDDFAHEVGEWADDPFGHTPAPCGNNNSILEVGDPLLGYGTAAYGTYTGTNGFSYHLQDLALLSYFGEDASKVYGNQISFQGTSYTPPLTYCSSGG